MPSVNLYTINYPVLARVENGDRDMLPLCEHALMRGGRRAAPLPTPCNLLVSLVTQEEGFHIVFT
jgi:hypothetical protein